MPNYSYRAIDKDGSSVSGNIMADSVAVAGDLLATRGYVPLKVKKAGAASGRTFWSSLTVRRGAVKAADILIFTKQLRSMIRAGISIVRVLGILEAQTQSPVLKKVAAALAADIKKGVALHDAMKKYPYAFSPLYLSMIHAGETSGSLPEVLKRLTYIMEHEEQVKKDVKAALRYPAIVLGFLSVAFFILVIFVMPKFAALFERAHVALPMPTRICIGLYHALNDYGYIWLGCAVAVVFVVIRLLKEKSVRYKVDDYKTKLPIIGPLIIKSTMSRFSSVFATLLASGVTIMNSFDILSEIINNTAISAAFIKTKERVREGSGLAQPLKSIRYFPPMVVDMIMIGEEGGSLDEMLRDITTHYDEEVQYALKALPEAVGPVLIVGLTAMVGFFALAVFLPMWDMAKIQIK